MARAEASPAAEDHLSLLCRMVLNFRLLTLLITLASLPFHREELAPVYALLVAAACASFFPLWFWKRISGVVSRHPALLGVDLVLGMAILTIAGPRSAFFFYTLSIALLAGVLYRWVGAGVFSMLLVATYWTALVLRAPVAEDGPAFQTLLGMPLLYPIFGAAGAAVRGFLERVAATESALAASDRAAAIERERLRLGREMHDSVAKTLHGVSLSAAALPEWIRSDPARAEREARVLAEGATRAAAEAREVIRDLRADSVEEPLHRAVEAYARAWAAKAGVAVEISASAVPEPSPEARWELFSILKEALTNVERHADARRVRVALNGSDGTVRMRVTDDGAGFEVPRDPESRLAGDHFGLVGMAERARYAGGELHIDSAPGRGTTLTAAVRLQAPARDREGA